MSKSELIREVELSGNEVPSAAPGEGSEFAASYCPRCAAKLEARSCKMICSSCGYYMSCSDFY